MPSVSEAAVLDALRAVRDPDLQRDIVTLKFVKDLRIDDGRVGFTIELTTPACPVKDQMREQARAVVQQLPGVSAVDVQMTARVRSAAPADLGKTPLPTVKNVIAVGAGKGGVGKTTVAVNLALALSKAGSRVAIVDGDIYGPNVPIMLGINTQLTTDGQKIVPAEQYGLQLVSMAFLTNDDSPVIWRGPMLHGIIQQFFREVRWDAVDYLIVDMPPGTGDVALSLSQTVPVSGSVVVTTPQAVSVADTRRAVRMYQKLNVPTLGRRRGARRGAGRAVSWTDSALRTDPPRRRCRRPDHRRRAGFPGGHGVSICGRASCGAALDCRLQRKPGEEAHRAHAGPVTRAHFQESS
jgi:ATP-binding protein involved in chromosome partitioning